MNFKLEYVKTLVGSYLKDMDQETLYELAFESLVEGYMNGSDEELVAFSEVVTDDLVICD
jgi:hypothetical protein